jgi:predicted ATP-binding protein involved in virulence
MALPMLTAMRVRSISVRKLFGRFDHTIPLNVDERITIIHGPNGYGKTALLRLVDAAFRLDLDTLRATPFESLRVELADGAYLDVCFEKGQRDKSAAVYRIGDADQVLSEDRWDYGAQNYVNVEIYAERYAKTRQSRPHPAGTRDLFAFLQEARATLRGEYVFQKVWLHHVPIHLVSVQRLLTPKRSLQQPVDHFPAHPSRESQEMTFEKTVLVYSNELREIVRNVEEEYASVSRHLDSTFPMRVVKAMNTPPVSKEELERALQSLKERRERLYVLDILPREDEETGIPAALGEVDDATRKVLRLYVRDVEQKLGVFEELAGRVALLQEIINQRFQFKRLKIDTERGFVFESDTGQELPPTALSSGEQHQLVMIYECLFRIEEDALLLIDEPELSLHVSWQVEFLRDLQRIVEIAKFDVLIATHSPQIIHDRWDLTVELQPPAAPPTPVAAEEEAALE